MSRFWRWCVAVVVTVGAFGLCSWVSGAVALPYLVADHADRWVIAAGCGVAVAALAAAWGYGYATAPLDLVRDGLPGQPSALAGGERSISVGGNLNGIASTGDNAVNSQARAAEA
jgi:hypothetical protein